MKSRPPLAPLLLLLPFLTTVGSRCDGGPPRTPGLLRHTSRPRLTRYRVTRLAIPLNDDNGIFLNGLGEVAYGDVLVSDRRRQRLPSAGTLPSFKEMRPSASGINNSGDVIGNFQRQYSGAYIEEFSQAVLWHNGKMRLLLPPARRYGQSCANGINNKGEVVGQQFEFSREIDDTRDKVGEAFLITAAGKRVDLGPGEAVCINDNEKVVLQIESEYSYLWDPHKGKNRCFMPSTCVWSRSHRQFLDTPKGYGDITGVAGINNRGQIAVTAGLSPPNSFEDLSAGRGFLWRRGRWTNLGTLGGESSEARGINNRGQVVGTADIRPPDKHGDENIRAFLWQKGKLKDLNSLIPARSHWVLYSADAINDRGQIVGRGSKGAFLLTPTRR